MHEQLEKRTSGSLLVAVAVVIVVVVTFVATELIAIFLVHPVAGLFELLLQVIFFFHSGH